VLLEKADDERPDDAFRLLAGVVTIADPDLDLLANGIAQKRRIDLHRGVAALRDVERTGLDLAAEVVGRTAAILLSALPAARLRRASSVCRPTHWPPRQAPRAHRSKTSAAAA